MPARRPLIKGRTRYAQKKPAPTTPAVTPVATPPVSANKYTDIVGDPATQVVVIKVQRSVVGANIPFDKIYLFPKASADQIPRIFGYALVLPVEQSLLGAISGLTPSEVSQYGHKRNDDRLKQRVPTPSNDWWDAHIFSRYAPKDRLVVVPILTSKLRNKINPAYLMAPKWFDKNGTSRLERISRGKRSKKSLPVLTPINETAYLATPLDAPNDKISPICTICPRILQQLQGECQPGQLVCLKTLDFNAITTSKPIPLDAEEEA